MKFGLHLGTRGAAAHPDNLRALAERADARGFAYLGMSDHIIFTKQMMEQKLDLPFGFLSFGAGSEDPAFYKAVPPPSVAPPPEHPLSETPEPPPVSAPS